MIDTDKLMESIYEEAEKELIKFGVFTLLTQMGFKVTEFNNKINLSIDNFSRVNEIINQEEIKKVNARLRRKINYNINKNIVNVLESEVVNNAVSTLQKEIVEHVDLQLSMFIKTKILKAYSDKMEKELTDKIMQDSIIRNMLIREL
jgi:hypothetical protein